MERLEIQSLIICQFFINLILKLLLCPLVLLLFSGPGVLVQVWAPEVAAQNEGVQGILWG